MMKPPCTPALRQWWAMSSCHALARSMPPVHSSAVHVDVDDSQMPRHPHPHARTSSYLRLRPTNCDKDSRSDSRCIQPAFDDGETARRPRRDCLEEGMYVRARTAARTYKHLNIERDARVSDRSPAKHRPDRHCLGCRARAAAVHIVGTAT